MLYLRTGKAEVISDDGKQHLHFETKYMSDSSHTIKTSENTEKEAPYKRPNLDSERNTLV
jgi:hypothetical protein